MTVWLCGCVADARFMSVQGRISHQHLFSFGFLLSQHDVVWFSEKWKRRIKATNTQASSFLFVIRIVEAEWAKCRLCDARLKRVRVQQRYVQLKLKIVSRGSGQIPSKSQISFASILRTRIFIIS